MASSGVATVKRNTQSVNVDNWAVGDGVTDDYTALLAAALMAQSLKIPLEFSAKTYAIASPIIFPTGITIRPNGMKILKNFVSGIHGVTLSSDTTVLGKWSVDVIASGSNNTGVYLNGSRIRPGTLTVTGLHGDQIGANGLLVGDTSVIQSNLHVEGVTITGFRSPIRFLNADRWSLTNYDIQNFMTGLYLINVTNYVVKKGNCEGTSPASTGGAGQNGILIEAQNFDFGVRNGHIQDVVVNGSPEHGYRIGGGFSVADVTFEDCIARKTGNAPGNTATGASAFKVLGTNAHLHYNIRWINNTGEDLGTVPAGVNNFAGFHVGFVKGMTIENPRLRIKDNAYSAKLGLLIFASNDVQIDGMDFDNVLRQPMYLMMDPVEPSPPIGLTNIRINGGYLDSAAAYKTIQLEPFSAAFKDIYIREVKASRGGQAVALETPTTNGSDTGSYTNVNIGVKYINAPTGSATLPVTGGANCVLDYEGAIYGTGTIASKDGGLYFNTGNGQRFMMKSAAWVQE